MQNFYQVNRDGANGKMSQVFLWYMDWGSYQLGDTQQEEEIMVFLKVPTVQETKLFLALETPCDWI